MSKFVLKRKTYSDENGGMSTGKKIALGAAGTLGAGALAFGLAKGGHLGTGLQKSANKAWASGGQLFGSQSMVKSGRTGYTKAIGKEGDLNARQMVIARQNITNAANNNLSKDLSMFKDIKPA